MSPPAKVNTKWEKTPILFRKVHKAKPQKNATVGIVHNNGV